MKVSAELLLQNGMYAGIALLVVILGIVLLTSLFLRLVHLFLLSGIWRNSAATKVAVGRTVWRWAFGFMFFMLVLLIGGLLLVTHLKLRLGDFLHSVFFATANQRLDRSWPGRAQNPGSATARLFGGTTARHVACLCARATSQL